MTTTPLTLAVERYEKAIIALEAAGDLVSAEHILEILLTRTQVNEALAQLPHCSLNSLLQQVYALVSGKFQASRSHLVRLINRLDARLAKCEPSIRNAVPIDDWHDLLPPAERQWLRLLQPPHWSDRYDPLWRLLSIICFSLSLPFFIDIINRWLAGGIDTGSGAAILGAGMLSLLSGGGRLTRFGEEESERILASLSIARRWWDEIRFAVSAACLALLLVIWSQMYLFAGWWVDAARQQVNPTKKEAYFSRAIALDPGNFHARYGLGNLYEEQGELEKALQEYIAAQRAEKNDVTARSTDVIWDILQVARLYEEQREFDKAQMVYKSAWNAASTANAAKIRVAENMVSLFLQQAAYDNADHWLKKTIELNDAKNAANGVVPPTQLSQRQYYLLKTLGRIYLEQGKSAGATRWFRLGISHTAMDASRQSEMFTFLGWTLLKQGQLIDAKTALESAIELYPDRPMAQCLMAQVLEKLVAQNQASPKEILDQVELCTNTPGLNTTGRTEDVINLQRWAVKAYQRWQKQGEAQ